MTPFPFDEDGLTLAYEGRYLTAKDCEDDVAAAIADTATSVQEVTFVAG